MNIETKARALEILASFAIHSEAQALDLFRDWWNNFLTVPVFAEHYGITEHQARGTITRGRHLHNAQAARLKRKQQ